MLAMVSLLLAVGCAAPRGEPEQSSASLARAEALQRSAAMMAQLDRVESELHTETAQVSIFAELQERHGQVSQMASRVTDVHMKDILRLNVAQMEKRQAKLRKRRAIAHATAPRVSDRSLATADRVQN